MHAPDFWQTDGLLARLLDPLGKLYGLATSFRHRLVTPTRVGIPVICIGNLTVGGAGKTPSAIAVARMLMEGGDRPHFLTRGYGGRVRGPLRVDPEAHDADTVGDEPLLLARIAPTWVSADRLAGARAAEAAGASHVLMDDGLQNPYLAKDLALLVIDGAVGFGNRRLLPAGPLREPVERGLSGVDAMIVIGQDRTNLLRSLPADLPILSADLVPDGDVEPLAGRRVLAFAGIGRPEKFFQSLEEVGADIVATRSFPDHHRYRRDEIDALLAEAGQFDAACITTEKDHVRLPQTHGKAVETFPVRLRFDNPNELINIVSRSPRVHAAAAK